MGFDLRQVERLATSSTSDKQNINIRQCMSSNGCILLVVRTRSPEQTGYLIDWVNSMRFVKHGEQSRDLHGVIWIGQSNILEHMLQFTSDGLTFVGSGCNWKLVSSSYNVMFAVWFLVHVVGCCGNYLFRPSTMFRLFFRAAPFSNNCSFVTGFTVWWRRVFAPWEHRQLMNKRFLIQLFCSKWRSNCHKDLGGEYSCYLPQLEAEKPCSAVQHFFGMNSELCSAWCFHHRVYKGSGVPLYAHPLDISMW